MSDSDLLGELLSSAADRLAAYGYLLTGSQSASEELVQDAVVRVFAKRRAIPHARAAEGYVRATMRNIHIDGLRREALWRRAMPGQVIRHHTSDPAEAVAAQDAIGRALESLSRQERAAVVLRYVDDLTVAAVAASMHLQIGTVKRYLSNALDKLAAEVGDADWNAERVHVVDGKDRPWM